MKRSLLFITILLFFLALHGVSDAQLLPFRSYSIEHGLSESVVHDLMQDHHGYIWAATGFGLNRFDGVSFKNYFEEDGLAGNKVYSLYEDRDNQVWVGTNNGVSIVKKDTIITPQVLSPLRNTTVLEIYQADEQEYWFATDGKGVWLLDSENTLTQYTTIHGLVNDRVRDIIVDAEGTLWFGTRGGLTSLKNGNFRSYTVEDGLPDEKIRELELNRDGGLWIGTRGGLSYFNNGFFQNYSEEDGLVNNRIRSLSRDENGNLWIGTEEGASFYSYGTFTNYSVSQGLSNNIVYATLYDREHNIWFGTYGGGISVFLGKKFVNFTVEEGLPNNVVTAITQDREGNHWIATYGGGIARYDGENFTLFNVSRGLVDNKVYDVYLDDRNRLFVGTRWGLSIYDGKQFYNFDENELPYRKIKTIIQVDTNEYWMGTYGEGALLYRDGEFTLFDEEDGLVNNTVLSVAEYDSAIWFATHGGVSRYQNGEFTNYTIRDGLPNNGVLDIYVDKQENLWFSTYSGLARYERDGSFTSITTDDGLPDEVCYFMIQDKEGVYWIGSNKGIIRFDLPEYMLLEGSKDRSSAFNLITSEQGLISNEMNAGAVYLDKDDILWFGSVGGLSRFDPELQRRNETSPVIHIENISRGGDNVSLDDNISLPSGNQQIVIEYIGINFTAPDQVDYEYRLKGLDREWQRTSQRSVRYSALLPGDYTFQVRAQNEDGIWSSETASVSFTVMAPFWMQWWFIIFILLVLGGIIYFIYHYYKVRKMVDMERMRVRIASDLHDDVGSSLTEIALHSDFLQTTDLDRNFKESLQQIGTQCRRIVSSLDDIVWSIDARNDTLGDLTDRMQDYINHVLPDREIVYRFEKLDMDEKLTVSMKENIYLIFKEAINNIAKHSDATKVEVELLHKNGEFDLIVHDNGSGIKDGGRKTGHGLRNMKMRADRINADIEFSNETGFTIHVHGNGV